MPIENEMKYVARDYDELEVLLSPHGWLDIQQGYLNMNARVRRITHPDGELAHAFTYKERTPDGRNLEFEMTISPTDFDTAWAYTHLRLFKRRVSITHQQVRWDIDFYRWSKPYFVVAEVEMPPDMEQPETILPALEKYIAYAVPRNDNRFTARRMADEHHVRAVAQALGL
jgi:CYTH domain-containing protein